jgi:hypothetical protein
MYRVFLVAVVACLASNAVHSAGQSSPPQLFGGTLTLSVVLAASDVGLGHSSLVLHQGIASAADEDLLPRLLAVKADGGLPEVRSEFNFTVSLPPKVACETAGNFSLNCGSIAVYAPLISSPSRHPNTVGGIKVGCTASVQLATEVVGPLVLAASGTSAAVLCCGAEVRINGSEWGRCGKMCFAPAAFPTVVANDHFELAAVDAAAIKEFFGPDGAAGPAAFVVDDGGSEEWSASDGTSTAFTAALVGWFVLCFGRAVWLTIAAGQWSSLPLLRVVALSFVPVGLLLYYWFFLVEQGAAAATVAGLTVAFLLGRAVLFSGC